MPRLSRSFTVIVLLAVVVASLHAEPAPEARELLSAALAGSTVEELAREVRESVVVVTTTGRDGRRYGVGTGFVVSDEGLIATNLHVVGEARPESLAVGIHASSLSRKGASRARRVSRARWTRDLIAFSLERRTSAISA